MKDRVSRAPIGRTQHDGDPPLKLADVYAAHAGFVWRAARRLGVPESAVEDVMHDVFLVVHRKLPQFDGRAAMTTWLFGITRGVASNHRRGRTREAKRIELVRPQPGPAPATDANATRTQAAAFVRRFLAELDEGKREMFEFVEIEGLTVKDAAHASGINVNTAHARLRAARKAFAQASSRFRGDRERSASA